MAETFACSRIWAIRLIEVFGENKYLKSYCRGFLRDIYKYLINAEVILGRFENAAKYFEELKEQMQKQYEYHQSILSDDAEKAKFNDRQIGYMEAYTQEFITEKQHLAAKQCGMPALPSRQPKKTILKSAIMTSADTTRSAPPS